MKPSKDIRTIFNDALDLEDPRLRADFLEKACGDDLELRQQIEALIRADDRAGDFLAPEPESVSDDEITHDASATVAALTETPGTVIGDYKLLQVIGEGGFGVVYMAEQRRPVVRKVALKIIKLGMDTKQVVARFEAERQALALMDHPNIAKVYGGGSTESGRPYFCMELVQGIPITQFCDENNLSTEERLGLFTDVCSAIQHAHQKGIIHRDIKPSNVLVAWNGDQALAKVIDFGIAKATQGRLTEKTFFTQFQQFIGTPAYMSPEQAQLSAIDVDTRSDIYSLGVLLYELMTGRTPFDTKKLLEGGLEEIRRRIREEDPPKPSTRVSTMTVAERKSAASRRKVAPERLGRALRGDLDWIVMKALEKDRNRRYETANGLAADLRRHLDNEPVIARPPSAGYRLYKAWRRNRLAYASGTAIVLSLIVGLGASLWYSKEANRARTEAVLKGEEATRQRDRATEALEIAQEQTEEAERQRLRAEYGRYISQIKVASAQLDQENLIAAREALVATPPDLRNWEWDHLANQACPPQVELDPERILHRDPNVTVSDYWTSGSVESIKTLDHGRHVRLSGTGFSSDGTRIATTTSSGAALLWDTQSGDPAGSLPSMSSIIMAIVFSHDDRYIVAGDSSGATSVVNAQTKEVLWTQPSPNAKTISNYWFSPDDTRLVAACFAGLVVVFDTETGQPITTFDPHSKTVYSVRFHANGESVLSASIDGSVRVWNLETGREEEVSFAPDHHGKGISTQIIHPDAKQIATSDFDGSVFLWDRMTSEKRDLYKSPHQIEELYFSHDGTCLFVVTGESVVALDTASGTPISRPFGPIATSADLAVSPDGSRVLTSSRDGISRLWAPVKAEKNGKQRTLANAHDDIILQAAFNADGSRIVTASFDKTVRVWETASERLIATFEGHQHEVLKANFSRDGRNVASLSSRGTIRVWNIVSGKEIFSV